jgi:hypothetical protein
VQEFDGIDGTGPAAFFILNALVKIHQWISNNHYAVGSVSLRAENFATAFAYKDPHVYHGSSTHIQQKSVSLDLFASQRKTKLTYNTVMSNTSPEVSTNNIEYLSYLLASIGATAIKHTLATL